MVCSRGHLLSTKHGSCFSCLLLRPHSAVVRKLTINKYVTAVNCNILVVILNTNIQIILDKNTIILFFLCICTIHLCKTALFEKMLDNDKQLICIVLSFVQLSDQSAPCPVLLAPAAVGCPGTISMSSPLNVCTSGMEDATATAITS